MVGEYRITRAAVLSSSEPERLETKRTMVIFVPAVMPECCFVIVELEHCSASCFHP